MNNMPRNAEKFLSLLGPLLFVVFWFAITNSGLVKPLFLPSPYAVLQAFIDIKDSLISHVGATLLRVIIGYSLGVFAGLGLGLLMCYNNYVYALCNTIIESWRPVPPVALVPFFILWFGFSDFGKIVLVVVGVALIITVHTIEAVRNVNPIYIRAASSLGATKQKIFSRVVVPAIIPDLRSGLRIALALSISLVIVSEFLGAQKGIGYLISVAKVTFSTHTIVLSIIILGLMSWILDFFLRKILDQMTLWKEKSSEALERKPYE